LEIAIMAGITRLICRRVVFEMLFWIGYKNAKMFIVGFL